jgi:hypothetical protein
MHMNAKQYVFFLHTQQGIDMHPMMLYRYGRDLRHMTLLSMQMNDTMHMVYWHKNNIASPPPKTWINHINNAQ